jgi:hypothetical protein
MELFQPNNLSLARPEFSPVDDAAVQGMVVRALRAAYGIHLDSPFTISRPRGVSVESQNLLVSTGAASYFFKRRAGIGDAYDRLRAEARTAGVLHEAGAKAPRVIATKDGEVAARHEDGSVALYVFEEGTYFSGMGAELDAAASEFGVLTRIGAALFADSGAAASADGTFLDDVETWVDEASRAASLREEIRTLCATHRSTILRHRDHVAAHRDTVESWRSTLHLDYHPLNLLMHDGEVRCVLDFEHFRAYPVLAGAGFAALKLIRQTMVDATRRQNEREQPALVGRWLSGWTKSFPDRAYTARDLGLGAGYRVLSNIHKILDGSLRRHDDRFAFDLAKQIGSLQEIEVIFERKGVSA